MRGALPRRWSSSGCSKGDRIATLAMNHGHHLVSWYGSAGMGGVLHTVNPRLFDEQLVYIINHAEDRVLLFDAMFLPIVERLRSQLPTVEHFILFDAPAQDGYLSYRDLIDAEDGSFEWVELDERDPVGLCYTSGTTGNPKGVLYEHRSNVIHAITEIQPDVFDMSNRSVILPIVPMFHANSWGIPFAAATVGAKLVFSATNDAAVLCDLMHSEGVTHSAGVPTVWIAMFAHMDATGDRLWQAAPRHHRRVGVPARDDRTLHEGGDRRRPRVGHDRNQPDRDDGQAAVELGRDELRRARRCRGAAGLSAVRGRAAHRR